MADNVIMTQSSYDKLKSELEYLKTVKRAEMAEALRKARAYGDLSENFEYHAARQAQGILNGQIAELERTLDTAKIAADRNPETDGAGMGSVITVRDLDMDDEWDYYLVDAVSADPINDRISIQSPVGEKLTGCKAGDVVEVETPGGLARYEILAVRQE